MQRFEHAPSFQPRAGRCWFAYWDHCKPCGHIQHYEAARRHGGGRTIDPNSPEGRAIVEQISRGK